MPRREDIEKAEFLEIISRYRQGKSTPEEEAFLDAYYEAHDIHENILEQMSPAEQHQLKTEMHQEIRHELIQQNIVKRNFQRMKVMAAAAAVILICSVTLYFYHNGSKEKSVMLSQAPAHQQNDILPGVDKAILTLSDGTTVKLEDKHDEALMYEMINKPGRLANTYNSVSTPRGTQYHLTLSDGSEVWLNSGSSISFPTAFEKGPRRVETTGEVYFEVAKKHQPFVVVTGNQEVEVLGTHFNINAYEDEDDVRTTLLEGSVKVSGQDRKARFLVPGQQSVLSASGLFKTITTADTEGAVAWKNGYFKFDRQDLQAIMRQVSRWYDVEISYSGNIPTDEYVGKIKRSENVSGVLRILKLSKINFRVQGKKIIVEN
ncbi:putative anti-sigma factor [Pedobacter sp. BAL39]|uniref:FecR family protein n=1 Tax=Pedobacter sp. BAL39 TaxID=391596 RepID=UPI0001559B38|nr:FecR family protein [Pedobacter sp. BAL39]EDM35487.1 putative anti-sigma factor [Pedobacter sp. BAL39]